MAFGLPPSFLRGFDYEFLSLCLQGLSGKMQQKQQKNVPTRTKMG